jgi:hypothetical protein
MLSYASKILHAVRGTHYMSAQCIQDNFTHAKTTSGAILS